MKLETIWYEALPYVYGFAGWAALRNTDSWWSMLCGVLLLLLAALILRMRWAYRTHRSSIVHRTTWHRSRRPRRRRLA
jgi:hypothetical protein